MYLFPNSIESIPLDPASLSVCEPREITASSITYRNLALPHKLVDALAPEVATYHAMIERLARLYANAPCLSFRQYNAQFDEAATTYDSITYRELRERSLAIGSGVLAVLKKVLPDAMAAHEAEYALYTVHKHSPLVAIFSANRPEWTMADVACQLYSLSTTALYDNLGDNVTEYILTLTESPLVFCQGDKVSKLIALDVPVKVIVSFDPVTNAQRHEARRRGKELYLLDEVEQVGRWDVLPAMPPTPDLLFTISFTSGTTGARPKGVLLLQRNVMAAVSFLAAQTPKVYHGKAFIFLPLTHMLERQTSSFALMSGYELGYPARSAKLRDPFELLLEDLRLFKPHYFSIVPRILTKFESYIKSHVAALRDKERIEDIIRIKASQMTAKDMCQGDLVTFKPYNELRLLVGFDNLYWTQTASAPINKSTLIYLRAALDIGVSQMYGMTETAGAITKGLEHEATTGSCGAPGITVEIKLQERADMGYHVRDGRGEIYFRGPAVFAGYYKNPEETQNAIDSEGWLHLGDVGEVRYGRLFIIDRVKNFFKLANGEYISPEKIETVYLSRNPQLQQLYVHGHPTREFAVGVVGISHAAGVAFLGKQSLAASDMLRQINEPHNKRRFLEQLNANVAAHLGGYERLGNVHIEMNPLTVEREVVTPTLKLRRGVAAKFFATVWERLYEEEGNLVARSRM